MNDTALIDGLINNPEFTTITGTDAIESALKPADERDEIDNMLIQISTPLTSTQIAEIESERSAIRVEKVAAKKFREDHACGKCGGSGRLPHYNYIAKGECFRCDGTGIYIPAGKDGCSF